MSTVAWLVIGIGVGFFVTQASIIVAMLIARGSDEQGKG